MRALAFVVLFAAYSCENPKRPPLPPPDGDGTCETALENLRTLPNGCGLDLSSYVANCHAAEKEEAEHGVRHPNTCVTVSKSCAAVFSCR